MSDGTKKANNKEASGSKPGGENTCGVILPKTACAPKGVKTQVPVPKKQDYDWEREESIAREMDQTKTGDKQLPGIMAVLDLFNSPGRGGAVKQSASAVKPSNAVTKSTTKSPEKPAEPTKTKKKDEDAAPITANGANGGGGKGAWNKKTKRNTGRCELVAYDDLECGEDEDKPGKKMHKHHVVPDYAYRPGARPKPGKTDVRAEGNPTLGEGLSICLTQKEHDAAHQLDKRLNAASKSTRGGAVAGTMTGGQAKAISAATIEKVTGGKKGGGCKKKDIQDQLDKQTPDDKVLRGESHAGRFNKMPDAVKASQPQKGTGR